MTRQPMTITLNDWRRFTVALAWVWGSLTITAAALWIGRTTGWFWFDEQVLWAGVTIYASSFGVAVGLDRFPPGNDWASARLMSAAFCRTILPLLALAGWAWYSSRSFSMNDGLVLAVSYFIPFAVGIFMALRELSAASRKTP